MRLIPNCHIVKRFIFWCENEQFGWQKNKKKFEADPEQTLKLFFELVFFLYRTKNQTVSWITA